MKAYLALISAAALALSACGDNKPAETPAAPPRPPPKPPLPPPKRPPPPQPARVKPWSNPTTQ